MAKRPFERKDRFYKKAKKEGYPARSAYKIMELDDRFKIFKPGRKIVDVGAAPGGWMMVAEERLKGQGRLAGIDLLPLKYVPGKNTLFVQGDFRDPANQQQLKDFLGGPADWVICDISPNISGIKFKDEFQSYELSKMVLQFVHEVLRPGGGFLFKIFPGPDLILLRNELKGRFIKMRTVVPEATRRSSTEVYIVCQEKKGQTNLKSNTPHGPDGGVEEPGKEPERRQKDETDPARNKQKQ